jgi:hypothetical protein
MVLRLPDAVEAAHMGHPDFRVRGKIFATLGYPAVGWGMANLTAHQQELFVQIEPEVFVPAKGEWGRRGSTCIRLRAAPKKLVRQALEYAWHNAGGVPRDKKRK